MIFVNMWSDNAVLPERKLIYAGNPSEEIWTTQTGKRLTVGGMTDTHVQNCYYMLRREMSLDEHWLVVFKAELDKRGIKI